MGRHARRLRRVRAATEKRKRDGELPETDASRVDINEENFFQDEIDQFHDEKERLLLEADSGSAEDDGMSGDEEEVMGWSEDSEIGEEAEGELPPFLQRQLRRELLDSDEEGQEVKSKEMSEKAWGLKKKTFYAVEGEDQLSGSEGSELAAELEEKEAIALQKRLTEAIAVADFQAPSLTIGDAEVMEEEVKEERVVRNLSVLSREDKLNLVEKESPELFGLLEDFESNLADAVEIMQALSEVGSGPLCVSEEGKEYLQCRLHISLLYCMNIMFYLHLKASGLPVKTHPVIHRMVEVKKLIGQLKTLAHDTEGQIKTLIHFLGSEKGQETMETSKNKTSDSRETEDRVDRPRKKEMGNKTVEDESKFDNSRPGVDTGEKTEAVPSELADSDSEDPLEYYDRVSEEKRKRKIERRRERERVAEGREVEVAGADFEVGEDGKRAVTYQISRNRGLLPQRKKELRNPRVKHRRKFKKALIKHKGQVREVIKELKRYGGEASGIRANVSHSVKIK